MEDIKFKREGAWYLLSSDNLCISDCGMSLNEVKQNFKKSVNLMLDVKLDAICEGGEKQ